MKGIWIVITVALATAVSACEGEDSGDGTPTGGTGGAQAGSGANAGTGGGKAGAGSGGSAGIETGGGGEAGGDGGASPVAGTGGSIAGGTGTAGRSNGDCGASGSCLTGEGTHDGNAVDLTCTGGEIAFSPAMLSSPLAPDEITYTAVCALDGYTMQLGVSGIIVPGTIEYTALAASTVDGVRLTLQVTEDPASDMSNGSPNFEAATLTITEHDPGVVIAGTFTGTWPDELTVDLNSVEWSWACIEWNEPDCFNLGMPAGDGCTCIEPPLIWAGEISGSFRYEF